MEQNIEKPTKFSLKQLEEEKKREQLAKILREKNKTDGSGMTPKEERDFLEKKEEDREDDNPRYGH